LLFSTAQSCSGLLPSARLRGGWELNLARKWCGNRLPFRLLITRPSWISQSIPRWRKITWDGVNVRSLPSIYLLERGYQHDKATVSQIPWSGKALEATDYFRLLHVWTKGSLKSGPKVSDLALAEFPPQWPVIGFIPTVGIPLWNLNHTIIRKMDANARQWAAEHFDSSLNPLPLREDLMTNRAHAAAWLFRVFRDDVEGPRKYEAKAPKELWEALIEKDGEFLQCVWKLVFGKSANRKKSANKHVIRITSLEVHVVSSDCWLDLNPYQQKIEIRRYLPKTTKKWSCILSA
jgi:hypothetical protein